MHLEAVFVFVHGLCHPFEESGFVEFSRGVAVHFEVTEGCAVVGAFAEGGFGEIVVM